MMSRMFRYFLLLTLLAATTQAGPALDVRPIKQWIARQADLHTLSADFVQTRSFRSLKSPLANQGHLWFSQPDSFRWQIGDPAKTIALKKDGAVYLIDPVKKKATRTPATAANQQAGMKGMPMMSFPMAKTYADFDQQFELLSLQTDHDQCAISVLPRDVQARKFLKQMNLSFSLTTGQLSYFEMVVRDGSSMRSDFSNVHVNEKIDRPVFNYDLTGYTVTDAK